MTAPQSTKKNWRKRKPATLSTMRQESWSSDEIWGGLTDWERRRVRRQGSQLNVLEPNWRAPRDDNDDTD